MSIDVRYVYLDDIMPAEALAVFNETELPWTFGDCHLSLIQGSSLLEWMEVEDDVSDADVETVQAWLAANPDVLIAL